MINNLPVALISFPAVEVESFFVFVFFHNTKMPDTFPWRWKTRTYTLKKKGNKSVKQQERVGGGEGGEGKGGWEARGGDAEVGRL